MIQAQVGDRFGRLVVLESASPVNGHTRYLFRCDCGVEKVLRLANVRRNTQSCGCFNREKSRKQLTTHGQAHNPTWNCWISLRSRCEDPNNNRYARYGGRGIKVCERWSSFENFYADMGERPSLEHSIDRLDTDGNYEPGNVRWATRKEQARNKSTSRMLEWAGMRLSLAEWCERAEVNYSFVQARLDHGWTWPQALYLPKGHRFKRWKRAGARGKKIWDNIQGDILQELLNV